MSTAGIRKKESVSSDTKTPSNSVDRVPSRSDFISNDAGIKVIIRIRPVLSFEEGSTVIVRSINPNVELTTPSQASNVESTKAYSFHGSYDEKYDQESFFRSCGIVNLLTKAIDGYNCSIFAYGQTGSGKTYSMTGPENEIRSGRPQTQSDEGTIQRSIRYIFSKGIKQIKISYCEIYNEFVYDLLNTNTQNLNIRYHEKNGFFVQDLTVVACDGLDDVMVVIDEGRKNRTVGSHELNKDSSRSHSLLTVYLDPSSVVSGKINFIDLAGSERLSASKSEGIMKIETGNINKSLFILGKVILSLSNKESYIPYRDSSLTKLLMDSLGGNSYTLMISCIAPCLQYYDTTLSTLKYSASASKIVNKPVRNIDDKDLLINKLKAEIELLRKEIDNFKNSQQPPQIIHQKESVDYGQINEMKKQYECEISKIKNEYNNLLTQFDNLKHTNTKLMLENQDLYDRLENLEKIFGQSNKK